MNYRYKEFVNICKIDKDDLNGCRFLAEYNLTNGKKDKIALIIMKNPSKADDDKSDQTINAVLDYMHVFKYSKVYVMNLIPIYGTDSYFITDDLSEKYDILKKNDKLIAEVSKKSSKIFAAWGGNSGFDKGYYESRIIAVKRCVDNKPIFCYGLNKSNNQPKHPSRNQWTKGKCEEEFVLLTK